MDQKGLLMSVVAAMWLLSGVDAGNIEANQCPVGGGGGCLQCLSSATPELERCMQLRFLTTLSTNHDDEMEQYCTGRCPIVLATANYYCGVGNISDLFQGCIQYDVEPTGEEIFTPCEEGDISLSHCELCLHNKSQDLRSCLQQWLLLVYNTNNTKSRRSYCEGNCPLTLYTSNWYCGVPGNGQELFRSQCVANSNDQYCHDFTPQMIQNDTDYIQCMAASSSCNANCINAMNKYGCCLAEYRLSFDQCSFPPWLCDRVETGGSASLLALPLSSMLIVAMVAVLSAM